MPTPFISTPRFKEIMTFHFANEVPAITRFINVWPSRFAVLQSNHLQFSGIADSKFLSALLI